MSIAQSVKKLTAVRWLDQTSYGALPLSLVSRTVAAAAAALTALVLMRRLRALFVEEMAPALEVSEHVEERLWRAATMKSVSQASRGDFLLRRRSTASLLPLEPDSPPRPLRMSREHLRALRSTPTAHSGPQSTPSHRLLEARTFDAMDADAWDMPNACTYERLLDEARDCCRAGRLWRDEAFLKGGLQTVDGGIAWVHLSELFPNPHVWPDGRRSYLYSYLHHASEVLDAPLPGGVQQGAAGDCYLLSAVSAAISSAHSGGGQPTRPGPRPTAVALLSSYPPLCSLILHPVPCTLLSARSSCTLYPAPSSLLAHAPSL